MTDTLFYDSLADTYDVLTDAPARRAAATRFGENLRQRYTLDSALDVACGTGLYALALAEQGVRVTGVDISPGMLRQAARQAQASGLEAEWIEAPMQCLGEHLAGRRYGAVLCMGNSLPHLLTHGELDRALAGISRHLEPGGVAVLQVLNYARVLAKGERVVGITRRGTTEYVRFYDFGEETVDFNVLHVEWDGETPHHSLHTTRLVPYTAQDLVGRLHTHGFTDVSAHGGAEFGEFEEARSETVMIVPRRPLPATRSG